MDGKLGKFCWTGQAARFFIRIKTRHSQNFASSQGARGGRGTSEQLAIFGARRARRGAELKALEKQTHFL